MEDERQMLLRIIEGQNAFLQIQAEQIKALTENKAKGFRLLPNILGINTALVSLMRNFPLGK